MFYRKHDYKILWGLFIVMIKFHEIIKKNKKLILDQCLKAEKILATGGYGTEDVVVYIDEKETVIISQIDNYRLFDSTSEYVFVCKIKFKEIEVNEEINFEELVKQLKSDLDISICFGEKFYLDGAMIVSEIFNNANISTQESYGKAMDRTVEKLFYSKSITDYVLQIEQRIIDLEYCYKVQAKKEEI